MKKSLLFLLAACLISMGAFANGGKKKKGGKSSGPENYYAISLGASLPMGSYGGEPGDNEYGWAKTGLHINFANMGFYFTDNIGISGLLTAGANPFDAKEAVGLEDDDSYWVYTGIMVGPLFTFPVGESICLDLRPVVGYCMTLAPEVNDGNDVWIKADDAGAFGYNIGASCRYFVSSRTALALNLDYFGTKQEYEPEVLGIKTTAEQNISLLGISFGVSFGL